MISRLALLALCSLSAQAQVDVLADGTLQTQACAYGRGSNAVSYAKTKASAALIKFIKGNKSLTLQTAQQHVSTSLNDEAASLYEQQRTSMIEGLDAGAVPLSHSSPIISGNDTCVTVSLNPQNLGESQPQDWQQAVQDISVTVIGQGWDKAGKTALAVAEQDALQRAVSQVVGVWLTQQHTQSSSSSMNITDGLESTNMQELISEHLSSHSEGLVKEWQTLQSKALDNGGVEVTIMAVAEKTPLIQKASKLLSMIGSPRVKVIAPTPLQAELKLWLNQQGIEVGKAASLVINAKSDLIKRDDNMQLSLSVNVRDLAGNVYGQWRNDPSLLSLPIANNVEKDLMSVHLASESQSKALHSNLRNAFAQVVSMGGLARQVLIPSNVLTQPEKLHDLISTLAGVSDVSIHKQQNNVAASLRFKGNAGELAHILDQALVTVTADNLSKITIEDEFTLSYK